MLQTTRYPVTLYTSADDGAPQITQTAGALKTVLKACLVTGYGNKQGAGWEVLFEESNKIALKSADGKSTGAAIHVNDTAGRTAQVSLYQKTEGFEKGKAASNRRPVSYANSTVQKWLLAACARGFVFVSFQGGYSGYLYLSDFPSLAAADTGNTLFLPQGIDQQSGSYASFSPSGFNISTYQSGGILLKSADGLTAGAEASFSTAAVGAQPNNLPYPSPVSGGFEAFPCMIVEKSGGRSGIRGLLPGIASIANDMSAVPFGTAFDNIDGSGDTFVYASLGDKDKCPILINTAAWEI